MDFTKTITHLGLCAGYGGIELGLKRVIPTLRSVALCEIESFAVANLVSKMEAGLMDPAPIWTDLKTFPWAAFRDRVDILTGGYPCQPFSAAGKRLGGEDPRHLWPHISRGISILQPRVCFFENVEGHITCGLHHVLCDLGRLGYRTTWGIFSASECGAPHQRKRVFILAMANNSDTGLQGLRECRGSQGWQAQAGHVRVGGNIWPSRPGEQQYGWEPPRVVNSASARQQAQRSEPNGEWGQGSTSESGELADSHRIDRSAQAEGREHDRQVGPAGEDLGNTAEQGRKGSGRQDDSGGSLLRSSESDGSCTDRSMESEQWQTQSKVGRNFNEPPSGMDYAELCISCDNRTDELRLLGNGVVPATAALAFRTLMNELCSPLSC